MTNKKISWKILRFTTLVVFGLLILITALSVWELAIRGNFPLKSVLVGSLPRGIYDYNTAEGSIFNFFVALRIFGVITTVFLGILTFLDWLRSRNL